MGISRSRAITLIVATATLSSNLLSSLLIHQLPDDPYHLARNYGWYLHFANVLSVFGGIGAVRQHALSVSIFSNYLILDTLLSATTRCLMLAVLEPLTSTICTPESPYRYGTAQTASLPNSQFLSLSSSSEPQPLSSSHPFATQFSLLSQDWTQEGCANIISLARLTFAVGLLAATILHFVGALYVREFARGLWRKECREDTRLMAEEILGREARGRQRERLSWGSEK